jgi:glycerophosphoryl diester phosphodiesterase
VPPLIIAHRGDSAHRPENTLVSFASALEVGARLVELDVRLTRDGIPVILHDPTLDRTTTGTGPVREHTLSEVRAVSAGYPELFASAYASERVPTLAEGLGLLRGRARVMIEIKEEFVGTDPGDGVEARTVAEVRRAGMVGEVAFLSFEAGALVRLRDQAPEIPRGHLFYRASPDAVVQGARQVGCDIVMPEKGMLTDELRVRVVAAGLKLATWVVDDPEELLALARFDLYGVASNRPGVLIEALADPPA